MTLLPRSLFGRLTLLLILVVALAVLASVVLFRIERANLVNRQLSQTKIVQLQAVRAALAGTDDPERSETLEELAREYDVTIYTEPDPTLREQTAAGPFVRELAERLRESLGPETDVRYAPRRQMLFVRVLALDTPYWIGVPVPSRSPADEVPTRALVWTLVVLAVLLVAASVFARYLARPLRELTAAVERVGRGETAQPLPESGPSEFAAVNRGFNAMTANLARIEEDRALLLAGVSHDLRTPLARLRLGVELSAPGEPLRSGMVADIEEMDRIIGQFLDFARGGADDGTFAEADLDAIAAACVARYASAGQPVSFAAGGVPRLPLKATAISRLVANLVDNALAYGAPPVEVATERTGSAVRIDVADRGPGIAPDEVERMKQPFTRASAARARADGAAGAGLGLAIVDRIARMHGGRVDLLQREGGGTIARVTLPVAKGP